MLLAASANAHMRACLLRTVVPWRRQQALLPHLSRSLSSAAAASPAPGAAASSAAAGGGGGARAGAERLSFQAETKQLLNIVTNSLYTDRHVFLRELISNASDALEKARLRAASGGALGAGGLSATPLAITVTTDAAARTLTVEDSGIGMTREELIDNLGTIARSGSRAFLARLREEGGVGGAAAAPAAASEGGSRIIGQFGVGFYSVFMVCDSVTVVSRGAEPGAPAWMSTRRE